MEQLTAPRYSVHRLGDRYYGVYDWSAGLYVRTTGSKKAAEELVAGGDVEITFKH